jgi:DNA-binding SARP family transcriptional activator
MIELRTLGALELTSADGRPLGVAVTQPRRMALLCYLALTSARGFQRRDSVLAIFWPEQDEEHARHALRQALYFLRRTLGSSAIVSRGDDELAIATDHLRCDATEFERALDEQRPEDALAMYRGDLLPGFHISDAPEFERWLDDERTRLRRLAAGAAWSLAEAREGAGDACGAAESGQRALGLSAGDELALRRLIALLDRLGDRAAAVRAYEAFARQLEGEYEVVPSEMSRAPLAEIRAEQREHTAPVASVPIGPSFGVQSFGVQSSAVSEPSLHRPDAGVPLSVDAPAAVAAAGASSFAGARTRSTRGLRPAWRLAACSRMLPAAGVALA